MGLEDFFKSFLEQPVLPPELHPFTGSESSASAAGEGDVHKSGIEEFAVEIGPVYDEKAYLIEEEQRRLVVDPKRGDWEGSKEELKEAWVRNDRLFTETAFELYLSIEANKRDVEDVCEFFEPPVLRPNQYRMLEEAYHTSLYFSKFDVSYDEEQRRRGQLGDEFGELAMNLPSLCSAGYFDDGGLFRDVYHEIKPDHEAYQDLFNTLVRHRPFVIFVQGGTGASEIYDLITQKGRHLDKLDIGLEAIHVRGIGSGVREKIISAREMLEENHPGVTCLLINPDQSRQDGETVLVIKSKTL